ncbi:MAG: DUF2333 family protein [Methylococcaceae bacterium]|nr:DUF2333 family protein [Methylococcaceae bacterium]
MATSDLSEDSKSKGIIWGFGLFIAIVLLVLVILGGWWGSEPNTFNVEEEALTRAKLTDVKEMHIGFVYTNTLAHMAEVLMHKPGGYITNDVAPPGLFLDNIQSWEYGALVMLRDATTALRNHFARNQSQSTEDPDLTKAEPYFYYERNSWALPSTESEYQKGIEALHQYMEHLSKPDVNNKLAQFYPRADNLWQYVEVVIKRLGGLSSRLTASTGGALHPSLLKKTDKQDDFDIQIASSWLQIDDIFYEARGASWALLHILQAIKHDFSAILMDKRAMNTVDIMIHELQNSLQPITSPMVLNGSGFGLFANYSLSMANSIARANAAALDLRDVMNRG